MITYIVDIATKNNLAMCDIVPRKGERIALDINGKTLEYVVGCILYDLSSKSVIVFVSIVPSYYTEMEKDIKWNLKKE